MIYVAGAPLDLGLIKFPNGKYYEGNDPVKNIFSDKWREMDEMFLSKGEPVVFITPGIKSGNGPGSQGYSYPRVVDYKTPKGPIRIAWADELKVENGVNVYKPISQSIGINQKTLTLIAEDIEEILFMSLFCPFLSNEKNPWNRTFLQDKEADAKKYEETESNSAVLSYWLFRPESPIYADEVQISTLCLAWGVNPDNKSIKRKKQMLSEAVKYADRKNDPEFNMSAFNAICEKLKDGQDTKAIDIMALMQKCINEKVIKFDAEKFAWVLLGTDGKSLKTLCKVPPQLAATSKNVIKKFLLSSPDDVSILQASVSTSEALPSKYDICSLSAPIPEDITAEYIENEMPWHDKLSIYTFLGNDRNGASSDVVDPVLIECMIVRKQAIPFEVKKKKVK